MAFTTVQTGQTIEAEHIKELQGALDGTTGYGQAVALTQLNSSSSYALDVRNLDSSNGYVARFKDEADAVILTLTRTIATFGKKIVATLGSFAAAADMFSMTATWNNGAATFNALLVNITNTASAAASRLIDLKVGGTSKFSVSTAGVMQSAGFGDTVQLVNEVKNWPPIVLADADLATLNLWWDSEGTPSTAPSVVDIAGEGITETYELALKTITDAASEGLSQTYTYADEVRIKSGRKLSALLAIWSVGSISVTAKLVNSDATETAASATSEAAWNIVAIDNHTLAGTWCKLQVTAGAAGTFFVVPLGVHIGAHAAALPPRALRFVDFGAADVVSAVDPGGAGFTDVDLSTQTSNLGCMAQLLVTYQNTTTAGRAVHVRRNGDATAAGNSNMVVRNLSTVAESIAGTIIVALDDSQIFEYASTAAAGDTEAVNISLKGYWRWA